MQVNRASLIQPYKPTDFLSSGKIKVKLSEIQINLNGVWLTPEPYCATMTLQFSALSVSQVSECFQ